MHLKILFILSVVITFVSCGTNSVKDKSNTKETETIHDAGTGNEKIQENQTENVHWSYDGESGPEKWATLCPAYAACNGKKQSPVDLSSALSAEANVKLDRTYHCVSDIEVINNGHSVQINYKGGVVNVLKVNGKEYELKQFHFHCPSEHTLDGEHFDGEAHFVHVAEDGDISVIGVFLKEGAKSDFMEKIIKSIPEKPGESHIITDEICAGKVFSPDDEYYVYEGSLTTPPCTEGVNWFVRKKPVEVSKEQIEAIKKVMPPHNARPVQPLNGRTFGQLDE